MQGNLYLLPNVLSEESSLQFFPSILQEIVPALNGLIAESEKEGRRYLKRFPFPEGKTFRDIPLRLLNEHTKKVEIEELLEPLVSGQTWGVISDAGLPCIADPGARLVALAKKRSVSVIPVPGPSSIVFALMSSGLSAQRFYFQGYLERDPGALREQIRLLEKESKTRECTQVCIEVPYRSEAIFRALSETLEEDTLLSVACDLTGPGEFCKTFSVRKWREIGAPDLHKKPVVLLWRAS